MMINDQNTTILLLLLFLLLQVQIQSNLLIYINLFFIQYSVVVPLIRFYFNIYLYQDRRKRNEAKTIISNN
jgi:hypothetical protein